jgi:precorrin-8X/cobalt-precorrin-8 methylmutase
LAGDRVLNNLDHPILKESFAIIDREVGEHHLNPEEYAIARRVIHATADFDYLQLLQFSQGAIATGKSYLRQGLPIVTDVGMVKQGIINLTGKTYGNPVIAAVEMAQEAAEGGKTRTETGLLTCFRQYPGAMYVIGNAPTALIALCQELVHSPIKPSLIVGVPVGFVSVVESKEILARTPIPQIRVEGRKGGSSVAAAIVNALIMGSLGESH